MLLEQRADRRPDDRHQPGADRVDQLGHGGGGIARDQEQRVQLALASSGRSSAPAVA